MEIETDSGPDSLGVSEEPRGSTRPVGVALCAFIAGLKAISTVYLAVVLLTVHNAAYSNSDSAGPWSLAFGYNLLAGSLACVCAVGLWQGRRWGWRVTMACAVFLVLTSLISFFRIGDISTLLVLAGESPNRYYGRFIARVLV
ncbi:MAG: hypothetical protein AAGD07_20515 [Planctomycetota bacterium]